MGNQEAIEHIKNIQIYSYQDGYTDEAREALQMAISALQAQEAKDSTEGSEELKQEVKNSNESSLTQNALDTISRTAAISELMKWVEKEEKKSWSTFKGLFHWTGIKAMLECLPSAQPEIIRCRDCIHAIEDALCGGYWCNGKAVTSDHYCGYAERRTDECAD